MMQMVQVTWLGASATLFALWASMLFRGLHHVSRDARAEDGPWGRPRIIKLPG
jgi:hypothetical protein